MLGGWGSCVEGDGDVGDSGVGFGKRRGGDGVPERGGQSSARSSCGGKGVVCEDYVGMMRGWGSLVFGTRFAGLVVVELRGCGSRTGCEGHFLKSGGERSGVDRGS